MMKTICWWVLILATILLLGMSGCDKTGGLPHNDQDTLVEVQPRLSAVSLDSGEKLNVVASTSIVADVVKKVGGDNIDLKTLIPLGLDPHTFEPTPQDIAAVADAHVVFSNGLGLEEFLNTLIANAGRQTPHISVSDGITPLESEGHEHEETEEDPLVSEGIDPHTWFDPNNVIVWVQNIKSTLQALDPANASEYELRAQAYQSELTDLDRWIAEQVAIIPEVNRQLVTDHIVFSYFAGRYGFQQIGTVIPGYSASAQPSAQELAELERRIESYGVKAIFVGFTVNPDLAQQIADDMGIQLVFLYTGSLTDSNGSASSYLDFMRYNTRAIVDSLK